MSTTRSAAEFAALRTRLKDFIDGEVIPAEDLKAAHDQEHNGAAIDRLRVRARALGFGPPRLPVAAGGLGLSWEECCGFFEEVGRSFFGRDNRMWPCLNALPTRCSASAIWAPWPAVRCARALP